MAKNPIPELLELLDVDLRYEDRVSEHVVLDADGDVASTGDLRGDLRATSREELARLLYEEVVSFLEEADEELVTAGRNYKKWADAERQAAVVLKGAGISLPKPKG